MNVFERAINGMWYLITQPFRLLSRKEYPFLTNVGIIISLVLTAWAVYISLDNSETKKMVRELKNQNDHLSKLVEATVTTQNQNSTQIQQNGQQIAELKEIVKNAREQNSIYKYNTAPVISFSGYYAITKIDDYHFMYTVGLINVGSRTAKKFRTTMSQYYVSPTSQKVYPNRSKITSYQSLMPNMTSNANARLTIQNMPATPELLNYMYTKLTYSYFDEITRAYTVGEPFYFQLKVDENLQFQNIHSVPDDVRKIMDELDRKVAIKK